MPTSPTAIPRRKLPEAVAHRLEETILAGELRPGDRLPPEPALAERFSVSRTAIREAIGTLAEKGLVRVQQGQGTFVTHPSALHASDFLRLYLRLAESSVLDLVEARRAVEVETAPLAATRRTDDDLQTIDAALGQMKQHLQPGKEVDVEAYIEADVAFHLAIARATRNPIFVFVLTALRELLRENIRQALRAPEARFRSVAGHERILSALKAGDPGRAREVMASHLDDVRGWIDSQEVRTGG